MALSPKAARPTTKSAAVVENKKSGPEKLRLNKNGFSLFFGKSLDILLRFTLGWTLSAGFGTENLL